MTCTKHASSANASRKSHPAAGAGPPAKPDRTNAEGLKICTIYREADRMHRLA